MIHIYKEERPWGSFERFTKDSPSTVKLITVNHGQSTSLQYHNHRQEYWRVIEGGPTLIIDGKAIVASVGQEFFIDKLIKHRISAPKNRVVILEISLGRFDEGDIVRLEDDYGRTSVI